MGRRRRRFAAVLALVAGGLWVAGDAAAQMAAPSTRSPPAEAPAPVPPDSALLDVPADRAPAPQPKQKMARIWANEPPLVRLARDRFGDQLSETDAKFFASVAANDWADFRPSIDATYAAAAPSSWADAAVLKADRITWLCTDAKAMKLVPSRGIWLRGASIEGKIDLYRCEIPFSLTIYECLLDSGLSLEHAKLQELDVRSSCSAAIKARGLQVQENVYFNDSCVYGGANFVDAHIAGDFEFSRGAAYDRMLGDDKSPAGVAINFHDAKVDGDMRLNDKFHAHGATRLLAAQIGRSLMCDNAQFDGQGQAAIDASRCQVAANVLMNSGFQAQGGVELRRARIGGDLDCDGGRFIAADGDAINADLVVVDSQVRMGDGFHAEGEVRLINANVAGDVDCDNGHFLHPAGDALSLDGAVIGRSLRIGLDRASPSNDGAELPPGFLARGTLRLWGTEINQDVLAEGGRFETPQGTAILACNLRVAGRAVLASIAAEGTVNLFSAEIEHELDLRGSQFDGRHTADQVALQANGMHVHGHLYCNQIAAGEKVDSFSAQGLMSLQFATIDMHWDLYGAQLRHPGGDALDASDCRVGGYVNIDSAAIDGRISFSRAKIDGMWILINTIEPERMQIDLRFAHIWVIKDERLDDWPAAGKLQVEGLVYDHFDDDSPLDVHDRLAWLRRQYAPSEGPLAANPVAAVSADSITRSRRRPLHSGGQFATKRDRIDRVIPAVYEAKIHEPAPLPTPSDTSSELPAAADAAKTVAVDPPAALSTSSPAGRRYLTQPYTQLAAVYQAIGQDEQANAVLVARAERIGELSPTLSAQGFWYRYLGRLIGYGYEPFRAIKIGLAIVVIGTLVFAFGARRNLMAETKLAEHVLSQEGEPRLVSTTYPRFNPLVYSMDVFLPFVDLQQICYWLPGERVGGPRASRNCLLHVGPWSLKWSAVLRSYFWFQTLAGWTLCTLLAAAVTGIVES